MAQTRTLTELLSSVREQADMVNSQFVTDAWLTERINAHYAGLYDILTSKGEDYFTLPVSFVVDGSSDNYALPANFYKLHGVDYNLNGQTWPMKKFMFNERHKYNITTTKIPAQTLTLWVTPPITKLVDGSDTLDGVNGWEEYIIYSAAIDARVKEESDISELVTLLAPVKLRIEAMGTDRDQGSPERIKDVTSQGEYPWLAETTFRYRVMGGKIYFIGCVSV
jgi:hypothetical protein